MTEQIKFVASLEGARVDDKGSWTLVLSVPLQHGPQVAALAMFVGEGAFEFSACPIAMTKPGRVI